jgi:hypothetical protein
MIKLEKEVRDLMKNNYWLVLSTVDKKTNRKALLLSIRVMVM